MKEYYNQEKISSSLSNFFQKIFNLSVPHLKVISFIISGIVSAESVVTSDIAKKLKDDFSLVLLESVERRFRRFFNSFSSFAYFFLMLLFLILFLGFASNILIAKSISLLTICFAKINLLFFYSLFASANSGIPIWFRCFKGKHNPKAYSFDLIKQRYFSLR